MHLINSPGVINHDHNTSTTECSDSSTSEYSDSNENSDVSEYINEELNTNELVEMTVHDSDELDDINRLLAPVENDILDDCVLFGDDDAMSLDDVVSEVFPSILAGDTAFRVEEDIPKGMKVSGHVIMNKCCCLLSRKEKDIICYKYQKHILQRIASVTNDKTVPLLYPESMLSPSIFWIMVPNCGDIYGSIPSGLLVQSGRHRFASMKSHVRCRLRLPGSSTSTNPSYISFMYDILVNLTLNREDSRIILNRGLMASTNETGLQVRSRDDNLLSDCVDNKQTVRNLCASQSYHKMD